MNYNAKIIQIQLNMATKHKWCNYILSTSLTTRTQCKIRILDMVTLQKSHFPIHQKFQFKINNSCNVEIEIQIINVKTIRVQQFQTMQLNNKRQAKTPNFVKEFEGYCSSIRIMNFFMNFGTTITITLLLFFMQY